MNLLHLLHAEFLVIFSGVNLSSSEFPLTETLCFQEIQERMPADPFEAELLMMAEAIAVAEKGSDDSSDESDTEPGVFRDPSSLEIGMPFAR